MRINMLVLLAAFAMPSLAAAEDVKDRTKATKTAKLADAEVAIVAHLHHVNLMEVEMGGVAQKQGTAAVKRYGEMLVRDHTTADKTLVTFAKSRGLAVIPEDKPVTDAEQAAMKASMERMAKLKTLKGADFDREYVAMMIEGHDKELAKTDPSIAIATDGELKKLLETRRVSLQRHADTARELQKGNAQASVAPAKP